MKTNSLKRFDATELQRFIAVVKQTSEAGEMRWLRLPNARTLRLIINQQDMSFAVGTDNGPLTEAEVYVLFPELKENVVDTADPLIQTTPVVDNAGTTSAEATTNATTPN